MVEIGEFLFNPDSIQFIRREANGQCTIFFVDRSVGFPSYDDVKALLVKKKEEKSKPQ